MPTACHHSSTSNTAGQVYWGPPEQALKAAAAVISDLETSRYNVDEGRPELRAQLQAKIEKENGLHGVRPLVCCSS